MRDVFLTPEDKEHNNADKRANRSRHNNPNVEQLFIDMKNSLFLGCEDFTIRKLPFGDDACEYDI